MQLWRRYESNRGKKETCKGVFLLVCILYRQLGGEGRIYKGSKGGREGKVQKGRQLENWEKTWRMDHQKTLKRTQGKGEGGCASMMCIGLECLCD